MVANRSPDCAVMVGEGLALSQDLGLDPRPSEARQLRGLARCQLSDLVARPRRPTGSASPQPRSRARERNDPILRKPRRLGMGRRGVRLRGLEVKRAGIEIRGAARAHPSGHVGRKRRRLWPLFRSRAMGRAASHRRRLDRGGSATRWGSGQRRRAHVHGVRLRVPRRLSQARALAEEFLPRSREIRDHRCSSPPWPLSR